MWWDRGAKEVFVPMIELGDRFWSKVVKIPGGCWEWIAGKNSQGYGVFRLGDKMCQAPRLAYEEANGPIPKGFCIHHRCRNKRCVSPKHLQILELAEPLNRSGSVVLGDRFWSKVSKIPGGCWEWVARGSGGYGSFRFAGKNTHPHRLACAGYYDKKLADLKGLVVHHNCKNKGCVNPKHLELMTKFVHSIELDSAASIQRDKKFCPQGHLYWGANVFTEKDKNGRVHRRCKKCRVVKGALWLSKNRAQDNIRRKERRALRRQEAASD